MNVHLFNRSLVAGILIGCIYFVVAYEVRWRWRATPAGKIIMGCVSALLLSVALLMIGSLWPKWSFRPYLASISLVCVFGIIVTMCVSITRIRKPPDG